MAAARRAAPALLARLAEADSAAAAAAPREAVTVPFEVARLVSRRWLGLVELPATVRAAVAAAVATARQADQAAASGAASQPLSSSAAGGQGGSASTAGGTTTKQLRTSSHRLTDALRRRSRTEARGGVHERPEMDPVSGRRQRPRQVRTWCRPRNADVQQSIHACHVMVRYAVLNSFACSRASSHLSVLPACKLSLIGFDGEVC